VFYSNYGHILYHLQDKARFWFKKSRFFSYHMYSTPPLCLRPNTAITFGRGKTRMVGLPGVWCKKSDGMFSRFSTISACD